MNTDHTSGLVRALWALHEKTTMVMGGAYAKQKDKVEELQRELAEAKFERDLAILAVKWLQQDKDELHKIIAANNNLSKISNNLDK